MKYRSILGILIVYYAIGIIFYSNTFESRVVFDQAEFILKFREQGLFGVLKCYGISCITSLYFFHLIEFLLYKLFGVDSILNGLFALLIHTINALLIFRLSVILFLRIHYSSSFLLAFLVGLLYLISPYASEVVVWGCTYHYLFLGLFLLSGILLLNSDIDQQNNKYKFTIFLIFFLGLFLHEISFVFIIIYYLFFILFNQPKGTIFGLTIAFLKRYGICFSLMLLVCFCIRYWQNGSIVGHYGVETHLAFKYKEVLSHFYLYTLKFPILVNSFEFYKPIREYIYNHVFRFSLVIIISLLFSYLNRYLKLKFSLLLLFLAFVIAILPALNLYYVDYLCIAGDRLGYIAMIMFYIFLGQILLLFYTSFTGKTLTLIYLILLITFSGYKLFLNNSYWHISSKIMKSIESTDLGTGKYYYFLNMPESYKGAYMYKTGTRVNPFKTRKLVYDPQCNNEFLEVLSMNLTDVDNKVNVYRKDSRTFQIDIENVNGNWFWKGNNGAVDYENELFKVDINAWNTGYTLYFKKNSFNPNEFLLFYSEGKLNTLKL